MMHTPEHCQLRPLWESQQPAESRRRIIVPLFACKDIFHGLIPSIDERQADYLWELECDEPGNRRFTVSVFAPIFRHALKELKPIVGMKKWLTYCERDEADTENFSIVTGLWGNAQNTSGIVSVRVIESPFDYVSGMVSDGHKLKREWGTEQQWASLVSQVVNNAPFNRTILSAMNLLHFDIRAMLAQWRSTDANKRWLTWLWYRVNEVSDYYGYVFGNLTSLSSLEKEMCHAIFRVVSTRPEWIPQYLEALESLGVQSFDREYFDHLDALPLPETRLALLTGRTHEERAFAIRTVGYWLRKGASLPAVLESIRDRFPLLAAYLEPTDSYQSTELTDYFRWYREQKLRNEYPGTTPIPKVNLENYDSRYSKLSQYSHQDCYMLWIDGMGVEWMPLLLWCIRRAQPDSTVEWHVTTSLVPTETQDNAQWEELACPYEKWNRLDSLAHKGMPDDQDYYSCIAYQFEVIEAAAERAVLLLKESDCVVITSDHGSSRMAALSFHISESLSAPVGSRVRSYGRYCELSGPLSETDRMPCVRHVRSDNTEYLVMTTHDHYSQSGNAAGVNSEDQARSGEIHGGMTPEEYLVPVVVLRRSVPLTPLDYRIEDRDSVS
ncbi:MAG: BREX-4 system phosphatase PglZ [Bacillota bacterium]